MTSPGRFGDYDVEVVRTTEAMAALREDWDRLCAACRPNVFSTFEWLWAWWHHVAPGLGRSQRLNILVFRRDGRITGVAPLVLRLARRGGITIRKLEFMGAGDLPDYQQPLFVNDIPGQTRALADHLSATRHEWEIVELHNLAHDVHEALKASLARTLPVRSRRGEDCPFFAVEPWDSVAQRASKLTRQTLRNQANRLSREGIRGRIVERPDCEPGLLDRMMQLEARRFTPDRAVLARWPEFFRLLFGELGPKGWIGVAALEKGPELVAYNLFFRCGTSVWDYTKAYEPAFAKLSPGTMLLPAIMEYAHARGYHEYDFLRGREAYKLKWATGVRPTFHLQCWHNGWRSRCSAFLYFGLLQSAYGAWNRVRDSR